MLKKLKTIYDTLPKEYISFFKYIPDRLLFAKSYYEWKNKISFDKNIIDKNLLDILNYSREHTKYGKEHIPKDLAITNVKRVLESLPLVSSYDLSTNLDYYISDEYKTHNAYLTTTGGTGRNPTSILLSNESFGIEWAHMHHIWSIADYKKSKDLKLTLRGKSLKGDKLIEFNPIYNEIVVDTFKVKDDNFKQFLNEIKKYDISYIHGYPSLLKEFIVYFEKYNYIPKIKGIFLGSEGATVEDKKFISDFFDAKVVHWYGQSEKVALAVDEKANGMFKVYTSYGYPRVVDGELVATTFVNRALPLINYKMGDGAEIVEDDNYIYLTNIQSRRGKDFVYLNNDKKISTTAINLHSDIQNEILYYQIHQKEFAKLTIKVLQKPTSQMSGEKLVEIFGKEMRENLKDFEIKIELVDESKIQKSHRGKMILLVQELEV